MSLLANLVRRVRRRTLEIRVRFLNILIVIVTTRQFIRARRVDRLILRSDVLGRRYRDLEGIAE